MKKIIIAVSSSLVILLGCEIWLRHNLFKHQSYSNSESIDAQLKERDSSDKWNILFVGDSETRWGISPKEVDAALMQKGLSANSFNHAFDGFGASWWARLLPNLLEEPALRNIKIVVVGVQMTSGHRVVQASGEDCGALQKPVLTSPFAIDADLDTLCKKGTWDAELGRRLFGGLWLVRYSSAVRSHLMPSLMGDTESLRFNSRKDGPPDRGFEPHRSIAVDPVEYEEEFIRWKSQYDPQKHFAPLPPELWTELTAESGFFEQLNNIVDDAGRRLVLFALPTNPVVIDTFDRRRDYHRNSKLLSEWAARSGVIFIDLGIQDVTNPEIHFSDMRHLSGAGAKLFSRELGAALADSDLTSIGQPAP